MSGGAAGQEEAFRLGKWKEGQLGLETARTVS